MGKRTPSKWLTLMAACFGLLMLYIDLFIVIVPSFSVFSACFPG
jgi:MFS transporter, DHA2 family, methylenomycin A resistance protein